MGSAFIAISQSNPSVDTTYSADFHDIISMRVVGLSLVGVCVSLVVALLVNRSLRARAAAGNSFAATLLDHRGDL